MTLKPFGDVTSASINKIKVQQKAFKVDKTYVKPVCGFCFLNKSKLRLEADRFCIVHRAFYWNPFFIFAFEIWRMPESFISLGKTSLIFGAKNDIDSVPRLVDLTLFLSKKLFLRRS